MVIVRVYRYEGMEEVEPDWYYEGWGEHKFNTLEEARQMIKKELGEVKKLVLRTWQKEKGIERYFGERGGVLYEAVIYNENKNYRGGLK